jgi:dephospho-CoA kinase
LEKLGPSSFIDGFLNRKFVAAQVFSNPALLNWLNQLTHPATIADSQHWMQNQSAAYAIREAALLFESGAENGLDYVIGVTAPLSLRIQRVIKRDGTNEAEVQKRMAHQMDEKAKIDRCDFVITNDEEKSILSQVLEIDQKLRELSTRQEPAQSSSNLQ